MLPDYTNMEEHTGHVAEAVFGGDILFQRIDSAKRGRHRTVAPRPKHLGNPLKARLVLVDPGFGMGRAVLTSFWSRR